MSVPYKRNWQIIIYRSTLRWFGMFRTGRGANNERALIAHHPRDMLQWKWDIRWEGEAITSCLTSGEKDQCLELCKLHMHATRLVGDIAETCVADACYYVLLELFVLITLNFVIERNLSDWARRELTLMQNCVGS